MPNIRSVSICIFLGTGSRYETDKEAGISHYLEHLMFRGTPRRPTSQDISRAIEGVGGVLNAGTDRELTNYWVKVTQNNFRLALDVLSDMVLHAKLDPADIEKERQIIIEEINMSLDSPAGRSDMLIDELLWPGHPLGRDIAGTKESVSKMTRDMMFSYLFQKYVPENTVVSVAGNIDPSSVVESVQALMGDWKSHHEHTGFSPFKAEPAAHLKVEKRDIEEVYLNLAVPGISMFDPGRYAFDIMNNILGAGMSSRLFMEVRDRLGLVYSIHSYVEHLLDAGSFVVSAGVEPKNLKAVIETTTRELARIKETVPEWELQKAKEITKGHLLLRLEDSRAMAGWAGVQETLMGRILTADEVVALIDKVTAEQVRDVAREFLVGSELRLSAVGPIDENEKLEELLKI